MTPPSATLTTTTTTTSRVRALAADPPAAVRVEGLQAWLGGRAARDAWGRPGRAQPLRAGAEVRFAAPTGFASAAARDALGADTVHYGTLSKALLASVGRFDDDHHDGDDHGGSSEGRGKNGKGRGRERSLGQVLGRVWADLTGAAAGGLVGEWGCEEEGGEKEGQGEGEGEGKEKGKPLLAVGSAVRFLSVTLALPKASLLGDGVALTACAAFEPSGEVEALATALELRRLRVPTLIGLNPNERLGKQFVIATVTIEGFRRGVDVYTEIESVVVKAMEESSFETLEALGMHLADRVLSMSSDDEVWQVCIQMEKPTAVVFADCPIVEVRATRESLQRAAREAQA